MSAAQQHFQTVATGQSTSHLGVPTHYGRHRSIYVLRSNKGIHHVVLSLYILLFALYLTAPTRVDSPELSCP